jgi:hypothetical protein
VLVTRIVIVQIWARSSESSDLARQETVNDVLVFDNVCIYCEQVVYYLGRQGLIRVTLNPSSVFSVESRKRQGYYIAMKVPVEV